MVKLLHKFVYAILSYLTHTWHAEEQISVTSGELQGRGEGSFVCHVLH